MQKAVVRMFFRKSAEHVGLHRCPTVFISIAALASLLGCATLKVFEMSLPLGVGFLFCSVFLGFCAANFHAAHLWLLDVYLES